MLTEAAYTLYGELYSRLWRAGWVRPGGNPWDAEREGRHARRSDRPLWLHAASLGEVQVARAYVDALKPLAPLYLTVQTASGLEAAATVMPDVPRAFAPLDLRRYAAEFVSRVAPRALIVFETEIWPHWLLSFDGPVWFANARLSSRSFGRYRRIRGALQPSWKNVRGVFAQSERDRMRFVALGLPEECVHTAGQIKQFSMTPGPNSELRVEWRRRLGVDPKERLWVAGSIRKDEIDSVLQMWARARQRGNPARLVLALRHLRNVRTTIDAAARHRYEAARISTWNGTPGARPPALFVLDTHGDLGDLYAAADLVLLGGTFAPHGGHNPNEAARFGTPVITGPFTSNIDGDLALLAKAGLSVRLENLDDFPLLVESDLVPDPEEACRKLADALSTLPNPALELAAAVEEELGSA
jgi:3-deoxy-D-manno-octulosonic-acid transferase